MCHGQLRPREAFTTRRLPALMCLAIPGGPGPPARFGRPLTSFSRTADQQDAHASHHHHHGAHRIHGVPSMGDQDRVSPGLSLVGGGHHTPPVSARLTGWQPSQACGLEDRQGTAGHHPDPDVPRRGHQARPHPFPCDTRCAVVPTRPPPSTLRDGIPPRSTSAARVEAGVILTCRSPTSRGRTSRMSAAMQTACAWAADDREARPAGLITLSSARWHTSTVLTRTGTGTIGEPTRRAMGVRWKPVTSSPALLTLVREEVVTCAPARPQHGG